MVPRKEWGLPPVNERLPAQGWVMVNPQSDDRGDLMVEVGRDHPVDGDHEDPGR
jgi:hypothetical protein